MKYITKSIFLFSFICFSNITLASSLDDVTRFAYTVSANKSTVEVIDIEDTRLVNSIKFSKVPSQVVASKGMNTLIVSHPQDKSLTLVDLKSDQLKQYQVQLEQRPDYILLSPLDYNLAMYDKESRVLEVRSIMHRKTLAKIENVGNGDLITFSFEGSRLYVVEREKGELLVVDLLQNKVSHRIKLSEGTAKLSALSRTIDGSFGFISNADKDVVYIVDLLNFSIVAEVEVAGNPGRPWGTTDGSRIMIPSLDSSYITIVSAITFEVVSQIKTVEKPRAINSGWLDTTAAVIGENGDIAFINLMNGTLDKKLTLDGRPDNGVVTSDSKLILLSLAESGSVALMNMKTKKITAVINNLPVDIKGIGMAVSNNVCH